MALTMRPAALTARKRKALLRSRRGLKRNLPPLPSLVVQRAEVNVAAPTGLAPCDWAWAKASLRRLPRSLSLRV